MFRHVLRYLSSLSDALLNTQTDFCFNIAENILDGVKTQLII